MTSSRQATLPTLIVRIGGATHELDPAAGVAVIGRDAGATIGVDDERISRRHVRLEPRREGWHAIDTSTNGMFVEGVRRSSVLIAGTTTVHLGAPDGIAVTLFSQVPADESTQTLRPAATEQTSWDGEIDPGILRAGRAVAERRQQLGISQRSLERDAIFNQSALIKFEKGRSWPRAKTLDKLETALEWPSGHIEKIRRGTELGPTSSAAGPKGPVQTGTDDATEVFTDSIQAPLMAETVEFAMHTLIAAVADLPDQTDPDFTPKATSTLADLRKLERLASSAARNAKGSPSVILALSSVRRTYNDLMMRAAGSPAATLGQRLYGARHRAELSLEEAANGAGLPVAVLEDAEAERTISPDAAHAIENLVAQLTRS